MKLEEQVCSLELAKRLKELGIIQLSLFYWHWNTGIGKYELLDECNFGDYFSAFTAAELFDILPASIDTKKNVPFNNYWLRIDKRRYKDIQYIINYVCDTKLAQDFSSFPAMKNIHDESFANALAMTIIYLIENSLMGTAE